MAGANYIGQGQGTLDRLMREPIPGVYSAGQDQLSGQYEGDIQSGMSNIAGRGLTTTGAVPEMFTSAGSAYQKGVTQNVAQGQIAQNQQRMQLLQALLGIGGDALQGAKSGVMSSLLTQEAAGDVLGGAFGKDTGYLSKGGIPGLLSWLGLTP